MALTAEWAQAVLVHSPQTGDVSSSRRPRVVFVHGLDSWRGTWRPAAEELAKRGVSSLALDLRGHGESPLGLEEEYSQAQLAADVRAATRAWGIAEDEKFVLVGHSMGGLVVMQYAADYPEDLEALVIEDIHCVPLSGSLSTITERELERRRVFSREFPSVEACRKTLAVDYAYGHDRFEGWLKDGRVFPMPSKLGAYWSAINPMAQWLAIKAVLNTTNGYVALQRLAAHRACGMADFPVHLLVAGLGGLDWDALPGGIHDMAAVVPGMIVREIPNAYHSIHNSALQAFVDHVDNLVPKGALSSKL